MGNKIPTAKKSLTPVWEELAAFKFTKYAHPIAINDYEFIVIPANALTKWWNHQSNGIYKYNIKKDEWTLFIKYPSPTFKVAMINIAANKPLNQMKLNQSITSTDHIIVSGYIRLLAPHELQSQIPIEIILLILKYYESDDCIHAFCGSIMIQIDLNSKEITEHSCNYIFGDCPGVICKDTEFHIVGGRNNSKHIRYINNGLSSPMEMEEIFDGFKQKTFCNMGLVYIPTQNCMLLLGGYEAKSYDSYINSIWRYSFENEQWENMEDIKLNGVHGLCAFGYVLSNDEKYLIIFGGMDNNKNHNQILILDVVNMKWIEPKKIMIKGKKKSKKKKLMLTLPFEGLCHAVIMPNDDIHIFKNGDHYRINIKSIIPDLKSSAWPKKIYLEIHGVSIELHQKIFGTVYAEGIWLKLTVLDF